MIFLPILKALYAIHQFNFVHRSVLPENVYLKISGEISLGVLEILKKIEKSDTNQTIIGGKHLGREAITGNYSEKVDIPGLGQILFQLCTLEQFDSSKEAQLLNNLLEVPPYLKDSQLRPLLFKMLEKDEKLRITSNEIITTDFINLCLIICISLLRNRP